MKKNYWKTKRFPVKENFLFLLIKKRFSFTGKMEKNREFQKSLKKVNIKMFYYFRLILAAHS